MDRGSDMRCLLALLEAIVEAEKHEEEVDAITVEDDRGDEFDV